jgi:uncharacterized membrane protein
MSKLTEIFRHYQATVVAIVICVILVIYGYGCQIKTQNPFNPTEKVTMAELEAQVNLYVTKVSAAYDNIEKQEAIRKAILEAGMAYAGGGAVDPLGLASTLMGIVGIGSVIDNRKKDSLIKTLQNANKKIEA